MPLTSEEITYFNDGINAILKKETSKNTAKSYIQENSSSEEVLAKLDSFIKKDFIAAASSKGIPTPGSLIAKSKSDLAKVQTFVGYTPPAPTDTPSPSAEQPGINMLESVNLLSGSIDDIYTKDEVRDAKLKSHDNSITTMGNSMTSMSKEIEGMHSKDAEMDTKLKAHGNSINDIKNSMAVMSTNIDDLHTKDKVTDAELKELNKNINNVYKILNISNKAEAAEIHAIDTKANTALNTLGASAYTIIGEPKVVTSCHRINKAYELGDIIAKGDPSIIGIVKAFFDCSIWENKKTIDHYFTTTGDASGCSPLLPSEVVFSRCIGALGISIDEIMG